MSYAELLSGNEVNHEQNSLSENGPLNDRKSYKEGLVQLGAEGSGGRSRSRKNGVEAAYNGIENFDLDLNCRE